jgi:hypothetical protein
MVNGKPNLCKGLKELPHVNVPVPITVHQAAIPVACSRSHGRIDQLLGKCGY